MLKTADINGLSTKRAWILIPALIVGVAAMFAYLAAMALWRDSLVDYAKHDLGETPANLLPLAMILTSLGFFLAPLVLAERKSKRYALHCPECATDLTRFTRRVIATRCCGSCGKQIVEGKRIHEGKVFERHARIQQRRFLIYWFWAWPILGFLILCYHWNDTTALNNCRPMLFIPGLIGTAATGWAFARTMDRRFIPQLGMSATVFCLGMNAFW